MRGVGCVKPPPCTSRCSASGGCGVASWYAGTLVGPSAHDVTGALEAGEGPVGGAVAVAREGCITETIAALQVAAARDAATDPAVRAALAVIAAQEMEHALLAWRYLRWALDRGDTALRSSPGGQASPRHACSCVGLHERLRAPLGRRADTCCAAFGHI